MTDRLPNIVLMNCDDLGYGDLGCYGPDRNPNRAYYMAEYDLTDRG